MLHYIESYILILGSFFLVVNGGRIARQADGSETDDSCLTPPENTDMVNCCEHPRHLWGNIKGTIHKCADKLGFDRPGPPPHARGRPHFGRGRRHFIRHRFHDGCFVECMFETEGFLKEKKVDREALISRLQTSLRKDEEWKATAEAAVTKCTATDLEIAANETCVSGAAETLKCIYKEMFMGCPVWLNDNEYCTNLKKFYERCPDGPPPEIFRRHKHHRHHHHKYDTDKQEEPADNSDVTPVPDPEVNEEPSTDPEMDKEPEPESDDAKTNDEPENEQDANEEANNEGGDDDAAQTDEVEEN